MIADQCAGIEVEEDEKGVDAALEPPIAAEKEPSGGHFHNNDEVGGEGFEAEWHQGQAVGGGGEVAAENPAGSDFAGGGEKIAADE